MFKRLIAAFAAALALAIVANLGSISAPKRAHALPMAAPFIAAGSACDANIGSVTMLLQLQNNVTDSSAAANSVTNAGVTFASSGGGPGGDAYYAVLNGSANLSVPSPGSNFQSGTGAFTAEGFINAQSNSGTQVYIDTRAAGADPLGWVVYINSGSAPRFYANNNDKINAASAWTIGTWTHWAVVSEGSGGNAYFYIGGVSQGSTSAAAFTFSSGQMLIGDAVQGGLAATARMASMRYTKGVNRYPGGTTFTPPAPPLPTC